MGVSLGYKQTEEGVIPAEWDIRKLGEIATSVSSGKSKVRSMRGDYPLYGSTGVISYIDEPDYEGDAILIARVGANAGKINSVQGKYSVSDNTIIVKLDSKNNLALEFN